MSGSLGGLAFPPERPEPLPGKLYEEHTCDRWLFDGDMAAAQRQARGSRPTCRDRWQVEDLVWELLVVLELLVERPTTEGGRETTEDDCEHR